MAFSIILVVGAGAMAAAAQDDSPAGTDSLAAASRRAREAKKNQAPAPKVYTNDNLPSEAAISFVGQPPASEPPPASPANAPAGKSETAAAAKPTTGAAVSSRVAADKAALDSAKAQPKSAKTDLDILQRKFTLDQQTYLSSPNHHSDDAGASSLQTEQDNIGAKQDEVEAAQKVVDDLEAKLAAEGAPAEPSAPPTPAPAPAAAAGAIPIN